MTGIRDLRNRTPTAGCRPSGHADFRGRRLKGSVTACSKQSRVPQTAALACSWRGALAGRALETRGHSHSPSLARAEGPGAVGWAGRGWGAARLVPQIESLDREDPLMRRPRHGGGDRVRTADRARDSGRQGLPTRGAGDSRAKPSCFRESGCQPGAAHRADDHPARGCWRERARCPPRGRGPRVARDAAAPTPAVGAGTESAVGGARPRRGPGRLTMGWCTGGRSASPPAAEASGCAPPGSGTASCGTAGPRRTSPWGRPRPAGSPARRPGGGRPLCSGRSGEALGRGHRCQRGSGPGAPAHTRTGRPPATQRAHAQSSGLSWIKTLCGGEIHSHTPTKHQ